MFHVVFLTKKTLGDAMEAHRRPAFFVDEKRRFSWTKNEENIASGVDIEQIIHCIRRQYVCFKNLFLVLQGTRFFTTLQGTRFFTMSGRGTI